MLIMFKSRMALAVILVLAALLSVAQFRYHGNGHTDTTPQYIIVHPPHLAEAAREWYEYRHADKWQVRRVEVKHTPAQSSANTQLQQILRDRFAEHQSRDNAEQFAVLLLGDVPAEDMPGIATWHFEQHDPLLGANRRSPYMYATDHPYRLAHDKDDVPDFALGRIPARTNAEALAALNKIKRYERAATPGPWRQHLTFVAGEGHFGPADRLLEHLTKQLLKRFVPDACTLSMTYAAQHSLYCPPADQVQQTVLDRLREPALLFTYIGHGSAQALDEAILPDRSPRILNLQAMQRLQFADPRRPIAFLNCCSAGWFDLKNGEHCLAEAMLFNSAGPVAVIAGSRITHPYANAILQKKLTNHLLSGEVETLGELDLRVDQAMRETDAVDEQINTIALAIAVTTNWQTSLADLRTMHVKLYNLLGDPALRLPTPPQQIEQLRLDENTITGRINNVQRGKVTVTIRTKRDSFAQAGRVAQHLQSARDFTERTQRIYPLVNDRVLKKLTSSVTNGVFALTLPEDMSKRAAVVNVYAKGADADGRTTDAVGSIRLQP